MAIPLDTTIYRVPGTFSIACPRCQKEAEFSPPNLFYGGEAAKKAQADRSVRGFEHSNGYLVVRYPEILPWGHESNRPWNREIWGICKCLHCTNLSKHQLMWPNDAYYATNVKGNVLWAWTRRHVERLIEFLGSKMRDEKRFSESYDEYLYLYHLPKEFKLAKNREHVLKKLEKLLREK